MQIDHVFIFVSSKEEANELIEFGVTEGSGRIHKGIGTANRRFFFENFYLEILWVENEAEAKNMKNLGIWERANFHNSGFSRFGLCLKHTDDTDSIFKNTIQWHPMFLPENQFVDILTNDHMPWFFRFPKNRANKQIDEPKVHPSKISQLTSATFNFIQKSFENKLEYISNNSTIEFQQASENTLILEFDSNKQGKTRKFKNLDLVIRY